VTCGITPVPNFMNFRPTILLLNASRRKSLEKTLGNGTLGSVWLAKHLKNLREIGFRDVDWIHWAQDRDRWRAPVKTVMNLRVP
jgi:hypothetical protein